MAIKHWNRMDNYSFNGSQDICHQHFEESCFEAKLQTRFEFKKRRQLKPNGMPTIFCRNPTQSHGKQVTHKNKD